MNNNNYNYMNGNSGSNQIGPNHGMNGMNHGANHGSSQTPNHGANHSSGFGGNQGFGGHGCWNKFDRNEERANGKIFDFGSNGFEDGYRNSSAFSNSRASPAEF